MHRARRRRLFLAALSLAIPGTAKAQTMPRKIARIGFLGMPTAKGWMRMVDAFRAGLHQYGWVEGRNAVIEFRWAEGRYERLAALAAELAGLKVDVIVTHATAGVRAAKNATTTIPIVIAAVGDAVAGGLVQSLAKPGGNVTGSSFLGPVIAAKRLDLLREALPHVKRIGLLYNTGVGAPYSVQSVEDAAASRGIEVHKAGVGSAEDLPGAFSAVSDGKVDAILINEDPMLVSNAKRIAELSAARRLPAMGFTQIAEAGGLMAFGASIVEMHRRAAYFVNRILKGAAPADLPVEQPTTFELTVNMKAAKAIGITVPQRVLVRADRVIE